MFERVLPIGTVVLLKGGTKRVMITGYAQYKAGDDSRKIYDYCAVTYPQGYISPETTVLFDHEQIEVLYAMGFRNGYQWEFQQKLTAALVELHAGEEAAMEAAAEQTVTEEPKDE